MIELIPFFMIGLKTFVGRCLGLDTHFDLVIVYFLNELIIVHYGLGESQDIVLQDCLPILF